MRVSWVILYAVILHMVRGVLLMTSNEPIHGTSLSVMLEIVHSQFILGLTLFAVGLLSAASFTMKRCSLSLCLILPQQFILVVSALASTIAIFNGHFADGVEHSWALMAIDQLPIIILAIMHTFSIMDKYGFEQGCQ